jgi:hypothetical protein
MVLQLHFKWKIGKLCFFSMSIEVRSWHGNAEDGSPASTRLGSGPTSNTILPSIRLGSHSGQMSNKILPQKTNKSNMRARNGYKNTMAKLAQSPKELCGCLVL